MVDLQLSVLRRWRTSGGAKIVGGEESEFDIRATLRANFKFEDCLIFYGGAWPKGYACIF